MPPAAVRGQVGNLPHEVTSFVGRRQELTDARRSLAASRLVTLTGIGGVGKTRLALHVGQDSRRTFPDGVWLVELGLLSSPALLEEAVSSALGLRDPLPREGALAEFLDGRHLLLIFDNCEHLVDAVARLTGSLLRSCRELRILATSREPLGVAGEAVLRVPPLAIPDPDRTPSGRRGQGRSEAVTLFEQRAGAVVPGFAVTDDNRAAVTRICQRLDGLPLPIELAAARLRALSAEQILQRLTDRYRLLDVGSRGGPTRQQTLRTCVDWSYELCTPAERELWSRLSVFRGRFELDAAEAICAEDLEPYELLDLVSSLVDKSILNRDETGGVVGYGMLETLRDYGAEKLSQTGEQERLRRRHRDWYEALVVGSEAEWLGPDQARILTRLDRERPNIRAATRFCLADPAEAESGLRIVTAMWPHALTRGQMQEGRHWIDRALAHQGGVPTVERTRALCAYALLASNQGQTDAARPRIDEARAVAAELADPVIDAQVAHAAGYHALFGDDLDQALVFFGRALDVLRDADSLRYVSSLLGLSLAYGLLGDVDRATRSQEEALAIAEAHGDTVYRAYCLLILALALVRTEPRRASALLEQVVRLEREVDDVLGAAIAVEAMAWIAADADDWGRAAVLLGAAQALWRTVGSGSVNVMTMRGFHEECVERTTKALGERAYGVAFRRGADSTFEDAVAHALGERSVTAVPQAGVLTRRERQVAELVAAGLTNRAIADTLVISRRTAEGHVEHVLTKLGFTSRSQIAVWVAERKADDSA
ncbi:ATP-binding protein [Rhodococcus sp. NPDC003318]|uniref:ATP-binding protein n=1 Tax=Rhodococcus sp. NPDC003318 TaxID=3364503 RepID=UPI0036765F57